MLLDHNKLLDQCNATSAETIRVADAVKDTPISTTLFEHGGGSCEALGSAAPFRERVFKISSINA